MFCDSMQVFAPVSIRKYVSFVFLFHEPLVLIVFFYGSDSLILIQAKSIRSGLMQLRQIQLIVCKLH